MLLYGNFHIKNDSKSWWWPFFVLFVVFLAFTSILAGIYVKLKPLLKIFRSTTAYVIISASTWASFINQSSELSNLQLPIHSTYQSPPLPYPSQSTLNCTNQATAYHWTPQQMSGSQETFKVCFKTGLYATDAESHLITQIKLWSNILNFVIT